jgi:hypothetical protein
VKNSKFTGISYIIASRDHSNAELGKRTGKWPQNLSIVNRLISQQLPNI